MYKIYLFEDKLYMTREVKIVQPALSWFCANKMYSFKKESMLSQKI